MLLNLTEILSNVGKTEIVSFEYEDTHYKSKEGNFKALQSNPLECVLTNIDKGKIHFTVRGSLLFQAKCDRCLTKVDVPIVIDMMEEINTDMIEQPVNADEYPYLNGYSLDLNILINNEILINWPGKILCKDDCKGICLKCGKDLNQEDCGCDSFVPDPRMAVLKDILNVNKEV